MPDPVILALLSNYSDLASADDLHPFIDTGPYLVPHISDLWQSFGEFKHIVEGMRQEARDKRNARAREQRLERKEARLAGAAMTTTGSMRSDSESEYVEDSSSDTDDLKYPSLDHAGSAQVTSGDSSAGTSAQGGILPSAESLLERPRLVIRLPAANCLRLPLSQRPMTPVVIAPEASVTKRCVHVYILMSSLLMITLIYRLAAVDRRNNDLVNSLSVPSVPSPKRKATASVLEPTDSTRGEHASKRQKRQRRTVSAHILQADILLTLSHPSQDKENMYSS